MPAPGAAITTLRYIYSAATVTMLDWGRFRIFSKQEMTDLNAKARSAVLTPGAGTPGSNQTSPLSPTTGQRDAPETLRCVHHA